MPQTGPVTAQGVLVLRAAGPRQLGGHGVPLLRQKAVNRNRVGQAWGVQVYTRVYQREDYKKETQL